MRIALYLAGLLLGTSGVALAEMRTWTFEQSGATLQAEVVGFSGDAVTLKKPDGKTVSVRVSYLNAADRAYLSAERSKQWKEVEILSLDGTFGGSYRKCSVTGGPSGGQILVGYLPPSVEAVLQARGKQAAQITNLTAQIADQKATLQQDNAALPSHPYGNRAQRRAIATEKAQASQDSRDLKTSQADLAKLQKAYDDAVKKTKDQTTVKMRNTGILYKGIQVWECSDPRKPAE
ncbi:MAG TPA: SHD1 domain-containing protein [Candidatus Acidoferrum sp.]|nr:SHD1 domain-containing protein [Candidatus Acidoferrum sp.]